MAFSKGVVRMQDGWERRFPERELDAETIAAMLRAGFPERRVVRAELLSGGLANTNYRVTLAGRERPVVLRVYVRDPAACGTEAALHRLVRDRVPVPDVLHVECAGVGVGGQPFMVLDWAEGTKLDALLAEERDAAVVGAVARAVGSTLARVHAFPFPQAGFFGPDLTIKEALGTPREVVPAYVEEALYERGAAAHLGDELAGRLSRMVREHAGLLDALDPTPRLVHADYKAQNLLVRRAETDGGGWAVAAVLDWEFAFAWTPLLDLAILLRYADRLPPEFSVGVAEGYTGAGGALPEEWRRCTRLLDLVNLCEFLARPDPGPRTAEDVRALLAATVEYFESPTRRPLLGMAADLGPAPSAEDIAEVRREMWGDGGE